MGKMDINDFADKLLKWYEDGLWAVDNYVFDVGIQTAEAIRAYKRGISPLKSGMVRPEGKGNGALMRVLPLALWHRGTDEELIEAAHTQSLVTHGNPCNGVCCALYCLWAKRVIDGMQVDEAYTSSVKVLRQIYGEDSAFRKELEFTVRPDSEAIGHGSGYVVDSLRSVRMVLKHDNFEDVIKAAILLGDDTDTTAAIAGGIAGIKFGVKAIPESWMDKMKGKELVKPLIERLLELFN
jgi:ADP-ribosylglycohydrolase